MDTKSQKSIFGTATAKYLRKEISNLIVSQKPTFLGNNIIAIYDKDLQECRKTIGMAENGVMHRKFSILFYHSYCYYCSSALVSVSQLLYYSSAKIFSTVYKYS
jgi:hypothetical protein